MNIASSQLKPLQNASNARVGCGLGSSPRPIEYSASDKAVYLMEDGRKLANLFEQSAFLKQDAKFIARADLLRETYRPKNIYHATDLINYQTGELFDGYGVLINSLNSRLSKAYLTTSARRARKRVREAIAETKLLVGERFRFLTLTMPYLKADVATVLKVKDRALTLLKKRKLWTSNIRAGFISEEMTIGDSSTFYFTHFHAHGHALIVGKYIDHWQIADAWTDCMERACAEFGIEFLMRNMVGNRLTVDIKDVATYARKKGKSLDDAVDELCKYIVKGSDYEKVPIAEIVEIDEALFGRQMIKSYGDFNNQKGREKKETASELPSLDTKYTTDGALSLKPKRVRRPSMVETGVRLISEGKRDDWLRMIGLTMGQRREFRVGQLAWKYPHATFRTLDGGRWFGVAERPPKVVVSITDYKRKVKMSGSGTSPYKLLSAPTEQGESKSSWDLFSSFCGLGSDAETENSLRETTLS